MFMRYLCLSIYLVGAVFQKFESGAVVLSCNFSTSEVKVGVQGHPWLHTELVVS